MSDIHGCLDALERRLEHLGALGFFEEGCADELVLLGDYVDRGPDSLGVVRAVMRVEQRCPGRVVALAGNHEDELLRWLGKEGGASGGWDDDVLLDDGLDEFFGDMEADFGPAMGHAAIDRLQMWSHVDAGGRTMRSFLGEGAYAELEGAIDLVDDYAADAFERACEQVRSEHADIVRWMRGLRDCHETDRQIFVHAGIDEAHGSEWRLATPRDTMLTDRATPKGRFYKDVVAGHTAASSVAGDPGLEGVFWDGASHFYIDGMTPLTGRLPVLVYDADAGTYSELDWEGRLCPPWPAAGR